MISGSRLRFPRPGHEQGRAECRGERSLRNGLRNPTVPRPTSGWRWLFRFHDRTSLCPSAPAGQRGIYRTATKPIHNKAHLADATVLRLVTLNGRPSYLVGTGTSVRAPNMTACCRRTNATKGFSRKSTSPTRTFEASASRGSFFMNLFFSCEDRENTVKASTNPNSA